MSELDGLLGVWTDERAGSRRFTMHLDFLAADEEQARAQAEAYARGLNFMRLEVDCFTVRVSADGRWPESTPVFCGSPGPDPSDVCIDGVGHPGRHHGPGATSRWTDQDVPKTPDDIEGIDRENS